MTTPPRIRFNDGAAYDRGMAPWSQLVGNVFLDWLAPEPGLRWVDVGCGNGAFTELIARRCAPAEIQGIDPSEAQIAFARTRPNTGGAVFQLGDAMALPFDRGHFDAAVMALVLFFVPDPARGVAEMVRVVRPGGLVCAYLWDVFADGSPSAPIRSHLRSFGFPPDRPPSADASRIDTLRALWADAGVQSIETRDITVRRTFAGFDDFWNAATGLPSVAPAVASMAPADIETLRARMRERLPEDSEGRVSYAARANAIKGVVAGAG